MDHFAYDGADFARNEADRAREDVKALSEKLDYLAAQLGIKTPEKPAPRFPGVSLSGFYEAIRPFYERLIEDPNTEAVWLTRHDR